MEAETGIKPLIWLEDLEPLEGDYRQEGTLDNIKYLVMQHKGRMYMGFGPRWKPHASIIGKHRNEFGISLWDAINYNNFITVAIWFFWPPNFIRMVRREDVKRGVDKIYEGIAQGGGYADVSLEKTISFYYDSETFGKAKEEDISYIMSTAAPDWKWTYE